MIFQEQKTETGYHYKVEEIFGTIDIDSPKKMTGELLDDVVLLLLKQNIGAETVEGSVKLDPKKEDRVKYKFVKTPQWSDDDDEEDDEKCKEKNIHTSTEKQESVSTRMKNPLIPILNWLRKFGGAFREAWKNQK